MVAPWPSPALSPAASRPSVRWSPSRQRGKAAYLPAPLGGPRRPGCGAPRPWWRLQCPFGASAAANVGVRLRPRRRHSRRGPWCARPVAARPARHRCSRACGLATTAVRCEHSPHLPAVTVLVPASIDLAATCSPQYSARARLSRASPRPRARSPPRGDP